MGEGKLVQRVDRLLENDLSIAYHANGECVREMWILIISIFRK